MADRRLLTERAQAMRKQGTAWERKMWSELKNARLHGLRFCRQAVIGNFIVDFYCPMARVVVELDGDSHLGREAYDDARKSWLEMQGNVVLRFGTDIVHWSDGEVLGEILRACQAALPDTEAKRLRKPRSA